MSVCVIIPMYGFNDMTRDCVSAVVENAGIDIDIIVVDDGSDTPYSDDRVRVIRLPVNSGFTNAVNQGILACSDTYKYIHILNNDTKPEQNFIKVLYDIMEKDSAIAVAGSVRIINYLGEKAFENYGADLIRGYQIVSRADLGLDEISVNWIPFCSVMISYSALRYLGLLDPTMRNHCSDLDYCLRARINKYKVVLSTKSKVNHAHEVTTKKHSIYPELDQKRLLQKISGALYAEIMTQLPLDCETDSWGMISFAVNKRGKDGIH